MPIPDPWRDDDVLDPTILAQRELLLDRLDHGLATTAQVAILIRHILDVGQAELFMNSFDELVVARGYDEVEL